MAQHWDGKGSVHEGGFASLPAREAPFLHFKATQLVVCRRRLEAGKPTLRLDLNPDGRQFRFVKRVSMIQLLDSLTWQVLWYPDGRGLQAKIGNPLIPSSLWCSVPVKFPKDPLHPPPGTTLP